MGHFGAQERLETLTSRSYFSVPYISDASVSLSKEREIDSINNEQNISLADGWGGASFYCHACTGEYFAGDVKTFEATDSDSFLRSTIDAQCPVPFTLELKEGAQVQIPCRH